MVFNVLRAPLETHHAMRPIEDLLDNVKWQYPLDDHYIGTLYIRYEDATGLRFCVNKRIYMFKDKPFTLRQVNIIDDNEPYCLWVSCQLVFTPTSLGDL